MDNLIQKIKTNIETTEECIEHFNLPDHTISLLEENIVLFQEVVHMYETKKIYREDEVKPLLDAIKYFVNRVENGTARSEKTYKLYKETIDTFENL